VDGADGVDCFEAVTGDADVDALAMPRKCLSVDGRGMPIGLKNESDMIEVERYEN
jgi:hypothetical protein